MSGKRKAVKPHQFRSLCRALDEVCSTRIARHDPRSQLFQPSRSAIHVGPPAPAPVFRFHLFDDHEGCLERLLQCVEQQLTHTLDELSLFFRRDGIGARLGALSGHLNRDDRRVSLLIVIDAQERRTAAPGSGLVTSALAAVDVEDLARHEGRRIQIQNSVHDIAHLAHVTDRVQCPERLVGFRSVHRRLDDAQRDCVRANAGLCVFDRERFRSRIQTVPLRQYGSRVCGKL
jgi:hypothetical protein